MSQPTRQQMFSLRLLALEKKPKAYRCALLPNGLLEKGEKKIQVYSSMSIQIACIKDLSSHTGLQIRKGCSHNQYIPPYRLVLPQNMISLLSCTYYLSTISHKSVCYILPPFGDLKSALQCNNNI